MISGLVYGTEGTIADQTRNILPPPAETLSPGRQMLVLIAERDARVRELQRFFLEKAGFTVEFADDGRSAFDRAVEKMPDLVVAEILIAPIDGLTLCRHLRDNAVTASIPVMIFSILSAASRATEAGAQAFLRKPIVESTFIGAVTSLMAAHPTLAADRK